MDDDIFAGLDGIGGEGMLAGERGGGNFMSE